MNISANTATIKRLARGLGFDYCGIARAMPLDEDARRLESWLNKGMNGSMSYMANHFELRIDPCKLVPGARSVITLLLNYFPEQAIAETPSAETLSKESSDPAPSGGEDRPGNRPKIAKYAYGNDYHEVIRSRMKTFLQQIKENIGEVNGRGFVDSAPVLERSWAVRSGLGWVGRNGNLINKQGGSFFFIATLITDLDLDYDAPFAGDFCGTCRRCIDACPTDAILEDKVVDGSKCISYFTIELKDLLIPGEMKGKFDDWMFGCDTCQDVCPWNRFSRPHSTAEFSPLPGILHFSTTDWEDLTEESFKQLFHHSPLKRSKFAGIRRNLQFLRS